MNKEDFKEGIISSVYPLLSQQFDIKRNQVEPNSIWISSFYDERKFYWKCQYCQHRWSASITSRLQHDLSWRIKKCRKCNAGSSFPEIAIKTQLEDVIAKVFPNVRIMSSICKGYEIDIVIKLPNVRKYFGIEYDSYYYHYNRIAFDRQKNEEVRNDYMLVRFREKGLPSLNSPNVKEILCPVNPKANLGQFDISIKRCLTIFIQYLEENLIYPSNSNKIQKEINLLSREIDTQAIEHRIYSLLPDVSIKNQLSTIAPPLAKEYSSQNKIKIKETSAYSNGTRLWECQRNEKHKLEPYSAMVNSRTHRYLNALDKGLDYNGCPYCEGKLAIKEESLQALYPSVATYINYGMSFFSDLEREDLSKLPISSSKKLPFACEKCNFKQKRSDWKSIKSLVEIQDNIIMGKSKSKSICPKCNQRILSCEMEKYYNLYKNGETLGTIAFKNSTSAKRVKKLIEEFKQRG